MTHVFGAGYWLIAASFVTACVLAIVSLPEWAVYGRPEWVALVVIFWLVMYPHRVGIFVAWFSGLFLDVLEGVVLGQNAISMAVLAYCTCLLTNRIRVFPLVQQCTVVLLLIGIFLVVNRFVQGMVGSAPGTMLYWLPCLTSAFAWPWVWFVMRLLTSRFRVA